MKKLIVAAVAVLAMVGTSFASNQADINVTSEPITQGSSCGKAGGFTLSFDSGTVFTVGDTITFDLDLDTTLCKDINLVIADFTDADTWGVIGSYATTIAMTGAIAKTDAADIVAFAQTGGTANTGVYFTLVGNAGSSRVTLRVLGDADALGGTLTFTGDDPSNQLIMSFLDGDDYTAGGVDTAIYDDVDDDGTDYDAVTVDENSLCIDVSETTAATIDANFDSGDDTYTFVPSDPQVAHIISGSTYTLYENKSRVTGNLLYPDAADQSSCVAINNEGSGTGSGFCATGELHANNEVIMMSDAAFAFDGDIQVTLEILVNGESGANGVYWAGSAISTDAGETVDTLTVNSSLNLDGFYLADGTTTATTDADPTDCEVEDDDKAVIIVASNTAAALGLDATNKYIQFDLPSMTMDSSEVAEGDVVSVKITIEKMPCGLILEDTWEISTFGCVASADAYAQRYPYFGTSTGNYANAIIITNVGDDDGTAELTLYETDGDIATASVDVTAHAMVVSLLTSLDWTLSATSTGSGTLGDARAYVELSADFSVDGAAMITNATTGESIGYLPRQD